MMMNFDDDENMQLVLDHRIPVTDQPVGSSGGYRLLDPSQRNLGAVQEFL